MANTFSTRNQITINITLGLPQFKFLNSSQLAQRK